MPDLSPAAARIRLGVFAELEGRVLARTRGGGDLIPLHIGDTYLPPPPRARFSALLAERAGGEGLDASGEDALYRYGATAGDPALKEALAEDARGRGLVTCDGAQNVFIGVGGTHAFYCAARALLDNDDEVLCLAPYWPGAPGVLGSAGARSVEVITRPELPLSASRAGDAGDGLRRRLTDALTDALTPRTRAIYFVTPNNPDGSVLTRAELEAIAEVASARDLWVFADEVYRDFAFDGRQHVSIAELAGMSARTIVIGSFSKSHALAGARVGFVLAPEEVVLAMRRVSTHTVFNVPLLAQDAALAALRHGAEWTSRARAHYVEARDAVTTALGGSGILVRPAEGATYVFLDLAPVLAGRTAAELIGQAIDRGVFVTPGAAFGPSFANHARLCFTSVPLPRVLTGVERLLAAL